MTITSRGTAESAGWLARNRWYASRLEAPSAASSRSRRRSSAVKDVSARVVRWPSRSVTTPTTWGRPAQPRNAAPPL